jgi:hypothetical protein
LDEDETPPVALCDGRQAAPVHGNSSADHLLKLADLTFEGVIITDAEVEAQKSKVLVT